MIITIVIAKLKFKHNNYNNNNDDHNNNNNNNINEVNKTKMPPSHPFAFFKKKQLINVEIFCTCSCILRICL